MSETGQAKNDDSSVCRLVGLGPLNVRHDGKFAKFELLLNGGRTLELEVPTEELDALVHAFWLAARQGAVAQGQSVGLSTGGCVGPPPIAVENIGVALGAQGHTNLVVPFGTRGIQFAVPTPRLSQMVLELTRLSQALGAEPMSKH